jgi:hypothetical protein
MALAAGVRTLDAAGHTVNTKPVQHGAPSRRARENSFTAVTVIESSWASTGRSCRLRRQASAVRGDTRHDRAICARRREVKRAAIRHRSVVVLLVIGDLGESGLRLVIGT